MKDSDIIKALECCAQSRTRNDCEKLHCPACEDIGCYFINQSDEDNYTDALVEGLCIQALDLINRREAEIERLQGWQDLLKAEKHSLIKSEAIKEFIKRFEKNIKNVQFTLGQTWEIQSALKQTKEEMVGE